MEVNSATQRKKVSVQNSRGLKLVGILHETGSQELVIICHGLRSSKDRIPMITLAAAFEKEGIGAYRFDFTGNGESEGPFPCGETDIEIDDLHSVVEHFQKENRKVVALIGHSKGGNTVTMYASRYHDVKCIVNMSGCFSLVSGLAAHLGQDFMKKIEQNGFIDVKSRNGSARITKELLNYHSSQMAIFSADVGSARITKERMVEGLKIDTRAACQNIDENCRMLIVHGLKDEFVPVDDALEFSKSIKHSRLRFIEGADHEYTSQQNELCSVVLDFMKDKLPAYRSAHPFIPSRI